MIAGAGDGSGCGQRTGIDQLYSSAALVPNAKVVDSGQASLSYTGEDGHQAFSSVVDSGQASLSYTERRGVERGALVVDSGQASLSYT